MILGRPIANRLVEVLNDDKPKQPLVARRKQKKGKYRPAAELNSLAFFAAIFSYNGEMDVVIKNLLLQQIKYKLQLAISN